MTPDTAKLAAYDDWMNDGLKAKVALVRKEHLLPVSGPGGVFFPPTFANSEPKGEKGSIYVTDDLPEGRSVIVDTVGSQANRMEALFLPPSGPLRDLVPQIELTAQRPEGRPPVVVNLLEAGHRAADALARFSDLEPDIRNAFRAIEEGRDYSPMAHISPLSLVFGVWDSRGFSGARTKVPRMVTSSVRAHDVTVLHRAAQFVPALRRKMEKGEIEQMTESNSENKLSEDGLAEAPSYGLGGVVSRGPIVREGVLSLVALRNLNGKDVGSTAKLRRYILGLAMLSLTAPLSPEYRSGCILVPDPKTPAEVELVSRDGSRAPFDLKGVEDFARMAAEDFGVSKGANKRTFEWKMVKKAIQEKKAKGSKEA